MERHERSALSTPVAGKVVRAAFDGGHLTSDAGVLVLTEIERRLGIGGRLVRCLTDLRAPERVRHTLLDMIRFRVLLIAAGYPDANDCDALRTDPAFKMALGKAPESGPDLCSQPTMSRLENLPGTTALKRMMAAMVELFCDSFEEVPNRIVLDIDDTCDPAHGRQQLAVFHAHYDERCFLPIHVYEATTGKPVAVILRPGRTPDGAEVVLVLRHVIRRIRARWPKVDVLVRGDGHYGRPEAMSWCERNRVAYVFGLAGSVALAGRRRAPPALLGSGGEAEDPVDEGALGRDVVRGHHTHLSLGQHRHDFHAGQGPPRRPEALETEHRPCPALDPAVVLLDQVVQPPPAPVADEAPQLTLALHLAERAGVALQPVGDDGPRWRVFSRPSAWRKKRLAAFLSRLAPSRKSTVCPVPSTAR
jgi:hypothetical protein